ncbi:MAG: hypothetical protein COT67_02375 [Candidatus Tagabacteria bacterium CG09_land_8_20_14_0_10_41_14]|uniref:DNA polymerase III subunit delta n=2 Tax=Candidatus Tagaibacteriota TaxID=1817918 RepID=A0A2H0WL77_9BACT|nr:MAG: hypothetical protein AUJ36_03435 [Parcubacteria group bacterium CG1_02_41_26]PIS13335.1 MAG: hypothetical protein COT67_02375 [Candidatus Tagabacteria bacterium CG09_land_8_20_14_0_10_41_14]PJE73375.1 MAG: hypothetical protein COV00_00130 [Candidatus Tagabacteria bacterium CG10_big_fil_rev_8_21_14_0_10_40_13]
MKSFHHGYLLTGDIEQAKEEALKIICDILGAAKQNLSTNPDFCFLQTPLFSIKDARTVRENASRKSFLGKGRVFIIESANITAEASNALLKTMEEPGGLSYFFIITPSAENILNTLRSRLAHLRFNVSQNFSFKKTEFVKKFLRKPPDKRMEMVSVLASEREKTLAFFDCLEFVLADNFKRNFSAEKAGSLDILLRQRNFALRRGASLKMILEYLCFVL